MTSQFDEAIPRLPDGDVDLPRLKAELDAEVIAENGQAWFDEYGEASWQRMLALMGLT